MLSVVPTIAPAIREPLVSRGHMPTFNADKISQSPSVLLSTNNDIYMKMICATSRNVQSIVFLLQGEIIMIPHCSKCESERSDDLNLKG